GRFVISKQQRKFSAFGFPLSAFRSDIQKFVTLQPSEATRSQSPSRTKKRLKGSHIRQNVGIWVHQGARKSVAFAHRLATVATGNQDGRNERKTFFPAFLVSSAILLISIG
ncbi:MAG: hypothetical protein IID45_15925, partial [Planctomycetes bacterium]|nr:hypothetical protein [Planctomycetota bacterium]